MTSNTLNPKLQPEIDGILDITPLYTDDMQTAVILLVNNLNLDI